MNSVLRIEEVMDMYNMKIRFTFGTSELVSPKIIYIRIHVHPFWIKALWSSSSFESECNRQSRGLKVSFKTIQS